MQTIFDYIKKEESKYLKSVHLEDGWTWNMKEHLKRSFLYLNSQFAENNENRDLRPNKNIVLPIMNIQFRTEGFDVKDIELYVDNPEESFKSLLIKKYHDKWALEQEIDTFIDEVVESYATYGGVLVRNTDKAKPEVINLRSLAFCNQHDLINHPFAIKHEMSFRELREQKLWGEEGADINIENLIQLIKKEKKDTAEIYEIHGSLPVEWLNKEDVAKESEKDMGQIQVVTFYQDKNNQERGVCLFKKKMPELPFKFLKRDKIQNRALGRGGVEELFESQMWTSWGEIKITEMLDSAAKTLFFSDDPSFKSRNNLDSVENNQILNVQDGRTVQQLDTFPRNLQVFNDSVDRFWQHAQMVGSAPEPLMGEEPSAGTPFKLYEAQQIEGKGMHKYRQGQLATFMDEIYRDWILPHLAKEVCKEQVFLSELSIDEVQEVTNKLVTKKANRLVKKQVMMGQIVFPESIEIFKQTIRDDLMSKGNKRFFKILKDEMKNISISVSTNIVGKQKNLALLTDKLVNVFRQYLATPQIRQDPEMAKLLNTILESSGLSPIMFGPAPQAEPQAKPQMAAGRGTEPLKQLSEKQYEKQK